VHRVPCLGRVQQARALCIFHTRYRGTPPHFASYGFLKTLGRSTGKANYKWLHGVLLRLRTCTVEIYKDRHIYARGLVEKFDIDEATRRFKVAIDPDMMAVYTAGWTGIDWDKRQQLRGKPLALWLYGYYASHAAPLPVKVDTLRMLSGSRTAELWKFPDSIGFRGKITSH